MQNPTAKKYSRIAKLYDFFQWPLEVLSLNHLRDQVISQAQDKILEVGIGTGKNLPFYPLCADLTGIDFSSGMLNIARRKMGEIGLQQCELIEMDIEKMSFPDESFDTIVSTFVFCTVPNPDKGLNELYRVLKPGGKAVFLEHMKSSSKWLNAFLWMMDKITTQLLGTSMLRETQKEIEKAGFTIISSENKVFDILRLIVAIKS
ncbi:MAG: methyltransferase domain-containing protein [Epsilonproteobacteria bacterium]|nr:methyltransferase domain-containing protein [Campylobacterota bacterium]